MSLYPIIDQNVLSTIQKKPQLFETHTDRVKDISFKGDLVLFALYTGKVQLWNWVRNELVAEYDAHLGPCRTVCFHDSQPIFVTGGDDIAICLWNYEEKKCISKLTYHLDYLRKVFFHPTKPWLISCGDDLTIKIYDFNIQKVIGEMTHTHYVIDIALDPNNPMILYSGSLDSTVKKWFLNEEYKSAGSIEFNSGINSVVPEKNGSLLVSLDRGILCSYNSIGNPQTRYFEGHSHNVSHALRIDGQTIMSGSEDGTIRVWKESSQEKKIYATSKGRIWKIYKVPSEQNLYAAATDYGVKFFEYIDMQTCSLQEMPTINRGDISLPITPQRDSKAKIVIGIISIVVILAYIGFSVFLCYTFPMEKDANVFWYLVIGLGCFMCVFLASVGLVSFGFGIRVLGIKVCNKISKKQKEVEGYSLVGVGVDESEK